MIIFGNVSVEVQFQNISISWKGHALFWRYSIFHTSHYITNFQSCDATMSISTLGRVHLWIHFLIVNHFVMKLGQSIDLVMGNTFRKYFAWFGGSGTKSIHSSIYQPTPINQKLISKTNRDQFMVFNSFEGVHWDNWKMLNMRCFARFGTICTI